jgi:hypothetical protein
MSQPRSRYLENASNAQNIWIFAYSDHPKWIKSSLDHFRLFQPGNVVPGIAEEFGEN